MKDCVVILRVLLEEKHFENMIFLTGKDEFGVTKLLYHRRGADSDQAVLHYLKIINPLMQSLLRLQTRAAKTPVETASWILVSNQSYPIV